MQQLGEGRAHCGNSKLGEGQQEEAAARGRFHTARPRCISRTHSSMQRQLVEGCTRGVASSRRHNTTQQQLRGGRPCRYSCCKVTRRTARLQGGHPPWTNRVQAKGRRDKVHVRLGITHPDLDQGHFGHIIYTIICQMIQTVYGGQILKITANAWQILSYRVNRGKSSKCN